MTEEEAHKLDKFALQGAKCLLDLVLSDEFEDALPERLKDDVRPREHLLCSIYVGTLLDFASALTVDNNGQAVNLLQSWHDNKTKTIAGVLETVESGLKRQFEHAKKEGRIK